MVMEGDLTWYGEHTIQYIGDVLQNCTPETYIILLTNATQIKSIEKKDFLYIPFFKDCISLFFREKGREGERKGEKYQCVVAYSTPPIGDLAQNPGMCPDWESNQLPFGSQAGTHSTEPLHPGFLISNS